MGIVRWPRGIPFRKGPIGKFRSPVTYTPLEIIDGIGKKPSPLFRPYDRPTWPRYKSPAAYIDYTQFLNPGLFTNTNTFFSPTVIRGPVLTPGLFTNTNTFFSPTIIPDQDLRPGLFTNTNSFFSPTVILGQVLTPGLLTNTNTFYSPSIGFRVTPGLLVNTNTFLSPTITVRHGFSPGLLKNVSEYFPPKIRTRIPQSFFHDESRVFKKNPRHIIGIQSPRSARK